MAAGHSLHKFALGTVVLVTVITAVIVVCMDMVMALIVVLGGDFVITITVRIKGFLRFTAAMVAKTSDAVSSYLTLWQDTTACSQTLCSFNSIW